MKSIHLLMLMISSVMLPQGRLVSGNEADVRQAIKNYVVAFNVKDFEAVSSSWAENATHLDHDLAQRTDGREAIVADIKSVFEQPSQVMLSGTVEHVRMITDTVASVDGQVVVTVGQRQPVGNKFIAILKKQSDRWLIDG